MREDLGKNTPGRMPQTQSPTSGEELVVFKRKERPWVLWSRATKERVGDEDKELGRACMRGDT